MAEAKKKKTVAIHRSFLAVLVLASFALGVFVDRSLVLLGGPHAEDQDARTAPGRSAPAGRELNALRNAVNALVERTLQGQEAAAVSVYFLDLKNDGWFGIREDEEFSPQGLLKLPVMMVYFKLAETDPGVLRRKLAYAGPAERSVPHLINPLKTLEPGKSYTMQDLIYRTLVYGDDEAFRILTASLPEGSLDRLYQGLSLDYDPESDDDPFSLKDYALFFRALYSGSYLNKQMSAKALSYLSQSSFRNGMVAGIPPNVRIASRFGVHALPADDEDGRGGVIQLREIGLVYYPNHPFLLGVTARGGDLRKLARVIRDISRFVYREVELMPREKAP